MFVKSRAAERRAFTQIVKRTALFLCAVYLTQAYWDIFSSRLRAKGKWRRDTNFYWQFKKFLPLAIYQWSNICRSLHRDCRLVFLFLLSPNYLDESACLNKERLVHKKNHRKNDNFLSFNIFNWQFEIDVFKLSPWIKSSITCSIKSWPNFSSSHFSHSMENRFLL